MIYLWVEPEKLKNRDIGEYDRENSPDKYLLQKGEKINPNSFQPKPIVNFLIPKARILKFDCLPNNSLIPLVNNRIKLILEDIANGDCIAHITFTGKNNFKNSSGEIDMKAMVNGFEKHLNNIFGSVLIQN